jgi:hypothetical protein
LGSQREGVGGFRIEVAALTGSKTVVGAKDELILDGDRDADANVGVKALSGELAWREGDVAGIEEEIEAVLANWVPLNPEVGDGFVEVDLGEEAIGSAEAVVYEAAEGVDTLEIGTSKGGLEVERDRAASRGVGGREESGGSNGADIASFARVFHAKGITPPGSIGLVEQRLTGRRLWKGFGEVKGEAGEGLKTAKRELAGAEFGVVRVGYLGFVMLPNAGLGGWSADVEAYADGQEIWVDGGGGSSSFTVESANIGKRSAVDSSRGGLNVFELARHAEDAKVVADGGEGEVALDAEPGLVLAVDGVAGKGAVGAEAIKVLSVEIEMNGGDEQIPLGGIGLAAVAVRSSAGHDGMRRPEVELILAAKKER